MNIEKLDRAIRTVCPIHGVDSNRVISFTDAADHGQRAAAQALADSWVFDSEEIRTCTPWQIRKALNAQGLRTGVEAAIAASSDQTLKDGWEFATAFRSDDPFVISMGASLGKSEAETAELINYASAL